MARIPMHSAKVEQRETMQHGRYQKNPINALARPTNIQDQYARSSQEENTGSKYITSDRGDRCFYFKWRTYKRTNGETRSKST